MVPGEPRRIRGEGVGTLPGIHQQDVVADTGIHQAAEHHLFWEQI